MLNKGSRTLESRKRLIQPLITIATTPRYLPPGRVLGNVPVSTSAELTNPILRRPRGISPGPLMLPLTVRLVGAITGRLGLVEARVH